MWGCSHILWMDEAPGKLVVAEMRLAEWGHLKKIKDLSDLIESSASTAGACVGSIPALFPSRPADGSVSPAIRGEFGARSRARLRFDYRDQHRRDSSAVRSAVGRPLPENRRALSQAWPRKFSPHRIAGKSSAAFRATPRQPVRPAGRQGSPRGARGGTWRHHHARWSFAGRGISLSIPAVLMSEHRAWVFKKTPRSGVRDDDYPLVDVCMATQRGSDLSIARGH